MRRPRGFTLFAPPAPSNPIPQSHPNSLNLFAAQPWATSPHLLQPDLKKYWTSRSCNGIRRSWGGLEGGLDQIWALREAENEQHYDFQPNHIGANTSFNHLFHIIIMPFIILFVTIIKIIVSSILFIFIKRKLVETSSKLAESVHGPGLNKQTEV